MRSRANVMTPWNGRLATIVAGAFLALGLTSARGDTFVLSYQQGDGGAWSTTQAVEIGIQAPNQNNDPKVDMQTNAHPSYSLRSLVSFPEIIGSSAGQIPPDATIVSATLGLTALNNWSTGLHSMHQVLVSWDESTVTWNNFGSTPGGLAGTDYASTADATFTPNSSYTLYEMDVTAAVSAWHAGTPNYGFIVLESGADGANFGTEDHGTLAYRPILTVEFDLPFVDCDGGGTHDYDDLLNGTLPDCNDNQYLDICELTSFVDQSNTPTWTGGWTNILTPDNNEQTFQPQLPVLSAVDVGLTDAPGGGSGSDTLTVKIYRGAHLLATASQLVTAPQNGLVHFPLPAPVAVTPGETLSLFLQGGPFNEFGWQYAGDTYPDGERLLGGIPVSGDWIFQTYGTYAMTSDCNKDGVPDECAYDGRLYWSDDGSDRIDRSNPDGTEVSTVASLGSASLRGVAVDPSGKLYWADLTADVIRRSDLDGDNVEDAVVGLSNPNGIALDWANGKIYWAEAGPDRIARANLDGTNVESLVTGLGNPTGIALDFVAGKIYWADQLGDEIGRADFDGSNPETLVSGVNAVEIAVDPIGGKMYWTTFNVGDVHRANLDGTDLETIAAGETNCTGIDVDPIGGKVYWSLSSGSIRRSNLDGTGAETVLSGLGATFRLDFVPGGSDCDGDGMLDDCQIAGGDCDNSGYLDVCELVEGYEDSPVVAIPDDNATGVSTTIEVTESGTISDLDLALHITHTWQGDVNVSLEHDGVSALVVRRAGSSNVGCTGSVYGYSADNFGSAANPMILDDSAAPTISCYAGPSSSGVNNYAGPVQPYEPLTVFNGMDRAGTWTLTVSDREVAYTGTLQSWALHFNGEDDCNANLTPDSCEVFSAGDFDANGVVDVADYRYFDMCFSGPGSTPSASLGQCADTCAAVFDADADTDIDLYDYAVFNRLMTP